MNVLNDIEAMRAALAEIKTRSLTQAVSSADENAITGRLRAAGERELDFHARRILLAHAIDFLDAAATAGVAPDFTPATAEAMYDTLPALYDHNRYDLHQGRVENRGLVGKALGSYLALLLCHSCGGRLKTVERPERKFDMVNGVLNSRLMVTVLLPDGREANPFDLAAKLADTLNVEGDRYSFDETPVEELLKSL